MTSGGVRARSGPAPDPNSYRSQNRDWVDLPVGGYAGVVPDWPLPDLASSEEWEFWVSMWRKPQAAQWVAFGVVAQVAMYVRTFLEASQPGASSPLKTTAKQLDNELGISIDAMLKLGWRIGDGGAVSASVAPSGKRQTTTGSWLKGVNVEGS
jgi:hypothetical protein